MIKNILFFDNEIIIYVLIEFLIILLFIILSRYSRNNGGAFDRRVSSRRENYKRLNWFAGERRLVDIGFNKFNADYAGAFEAVTERRVSDRRTIADRRTT